MSFETKLRRLAKKLPESEVPSGLQQRILSHLPERHTLQKVGFNMKMILIPALALAFGGGGGVLFVLSTQRQPITAQRTPVQTGPITLHVVDEAGKPVTGASVTLWRNEKYDVINGPTRVTLPVGTTNQSGDLALPQQRITNFQVTSLDGHHLYALGEITVSEGQQVITLSEHPVHSITGQLVDEQGKPLAGLQPELYVGSQLFSKLYTGPDGHFIAWIVPGTDYTLVFHRTGPGNPIEMKNLRVEKGQFLDLGTVTVRSGTTQAR